MEFDLRPQWRLSGFRSHKPMCGQCGKFHQGVCFSNMQNCYKCGHRGHYARMCFTWTRQENQLSNQKSKSIKKKERDMVRLKLYLAKKQEMREMPFSNLRNSTMMLNLNASHSIKTELQAIKQKLNRTEATKKDQETKMKQCVIQLENLEEKCNRIRDNLAASERRNSELLLQIQQLETKNVALQEELQQHRSFRPEQDAQFLRLQNQSLLSTLEEANKAKAALAFRLHQAEENADEIVLKHPFYLGLKESKVELESKVREIVEKTSITLDMVKLRGETIVQQQQTIEQLQQQLDEYQQPQYYQDQNYHEPSHYYPPQQFQQQHSFRGNGHRNNYRRF